MRTNPLLFALVVCSVVVAGVNLANADIRNGLVGYYPLDEGTGTIAHDMSGNGTRRDALQWHHLDLTRLPGRRHQQQRHG